jgi:hypothetical protein
VDEWKHLRERPEDLPPKNQGFSGSRSLQQFNIAMENGPFMDDKNEDLRTKNDDFPLRSAKFLMGCDPPKNPPWQWFFFPTHR